MKPRTKSRVWEVIRIIIGIVFGIILGATMTIFFVWGMILSLGVGVDVIADFINWNIMALTDEASDIKYFCENLLVIDGIEEYSSRDSLNILSNGDMGVMGRVQG